MRETGAVLVTTRSTVQELLESGSAPPYAMEKLRAMARTHAQAMPASHAAILNVGQCRAWMTSWTDLNRLT